MRWTPLILASLSLSLAMPAHAQGEGPVLEDFFTGRFVGEGEFSDTRAGTQRHVTVHMQGTRAGDVLRLREQIAFSDGEQHDKTWTFTRTADGRTVGRRADVIGDAVVTQHGNAVLMRYTAHVPTKGGSTYSVHFADHLTFVDPRTVTSSADMTYLLFTVGTLQMTIHKVADR